MIGSFKASNRIAMHSSVLQNRMAIGLGLGGMSWPRATCNQCWGRSRAINFFWLPWLLWLCCCAFRYYLAGIVTTAITSISGFLASLRFLQHCVRRIFGQRN